MSEKRRRSSLLQDLVNKRASEGEEQVDYDCCCRRILQGDYVNRRVLVRGPVEIGIPLAL